MWTLSSMIECVVLLVIVELTTVTCETKFDNTPLNVTVTMGKTAVLPCRVTGGGDHLMILWMNPKKILISQRDIRYIDDPRITIERPFIGDWNLHIRYIRYQDRGEYKCTINSDPIEIRRIRLIVQVPSHIDDKLSTAEVKAVEGSDVKLTCNATGLPPPTVTWFKKADQDQQSEKMSHEGGVLMIHNISRFMGGIYECVAYNDVPPAVKRQIPVYVLFKPEIKLTNTRLGQYRGKETILECRITAAPLDSYSWRRIANGKSIDDNWTYRQDVFQEDRYTITLTLRILSVEQEDFGIYTCEASNSVGRTQASMELYEYYSPVKNTQETTTKIIPLLTTIRQRVVTQSYHHVDNYIDDDKNDYSNVNNDNRNTNKDSLLSDYDKSKELATKRYTYPGRRPEYRPEKQITGHVGTGYVLLNNAADGRPITGHFTSMLVGVTVLLLQWNCFNFYGT